MWPRDRFRRACPPHRGPRCDRCGEHQCVLRRKVIRLTFSAGWRATRFRTVVDEVDEGTSRAAKTVPEDTLRHNAQHPASMLQAPAVWLDAAGNSRERRAGDKLEACIRSR